MLLVNNVQANKLKTDYKQSYLRTYLPLFISLVLVLIMSCLLQIIELNKVTDIYKLMDNFMGSFFVLFAIPKFFDISGFAKSFSNYDFIGSRYKIYAHLYPFIEICLGLSYLNKLITNSNTGSLVINSLVLIITSTAMLGVARSLRKKQNLSCACMGSLFKFPLSKIALFENGIMFLMALAMLISVNNLHTSMSAIILHRAYIK